MGGGDPGFFVLPFPSRYDRVVSQRVLRDGATVWTNPDVGFGHRDVDMFASPDEALLAFQARMPDVPLRIHDLATGREISIPEPDAMPGTIPSGSGYQARFFGWSPDSRYLYIVTQEADFNDNVDERWFRSIWSVDIRDGRTSLDHRCEDRFPHNPDQGPDWSATACAG